MNIRRAEEKDITGILNLLSQVLEVHAAIRPDYFISGTTKFTREELKKMIKHRKSIFSLGLRCLILGES